MNANDDIKWDAVRGLERSNEEVKEACIMVNDYNEVEGFPEHGAFFEDWVLNMTEDRNEEKFLKLVALLERLAEE